MTKEEKIHQAWIDVQDHIQSEGVPFYDSDGWAKYGSKQNSDFFKTLEEKEWLGYFFYRPKSLQGIEDNNGWLTINNAEDLPACYSTFYWVEGRIGPMIGGDLAGYFYMQKKSLRIYPIEKPKGSLY